jgi:O-acetyl-ADP-ribose deacetylase (regulator of RNase III)
MKIAKLTYVKGDATNPVGPGKKIIAHVCNNYGGWGAGFVLAISKKWPSPEKVYRDSAFYTNLELGTTQFVSVSETITVANMIAQNGFVSKNNPVAISYADLRLCLFDVMVRARHEGASVHGPKFGAGLGGGDWKVIEKIIQEELVSKGVPVTIYEYEAK